MREYPCGRRLVRLLCLCLGLAAAAGASDARSSSPSHVWNRGFGTYWTESVNAVAVDALGNVFLTGTFFETVDFGGPTLVGDFGSHDAFLVKLDANGNQLWSRVFSGSNTDEGMALAVDAAGSVVVAGNFLPPANFGGTTLTTGRIFLAKYDANGAHQWSQSTGVVSSPAYAYVKRLALDGAGNVFLTGRFAGSATLGGVAFAGAGSDDIFLLKYLSTGPVAWASRFGGDDADQGSDVAVDASGSVFLTGTISNTVSFGGTPLASAGFSDVFIAKFSTGGAHQWSQRHGGLSFDRCNALAVDASGNAIITGEFEGTSNFGGAALVNTSGTRDVFLAKYGPAGAHQWSRGFAGNGFDAGIGIEVTATGDIAVAGSFGNLFGTNGLTIDFGGAQHVSQGESDAFLAVFDAGGAYLRSTAFGGPYADLPLDFAGRSSGEVAIVGTFRESLSINGASLFGAGEADLFVAKYRLEAAEPAIRSVVDIGNDQGRQVRIAFARSGLDAAGRSLPVVRYDAYRRDDASANGFPGTGWQYVASVPAHGESEYSVRAATAGDSTAAGGAWYSAYIIRAVTQDGYVFHDSAPDSGCSVDNLAPGVPANLAYGAGVLAWNGPTAPDFDHFTVYGSVAGSMDAAVVIDETTAPTLDVTGAAYAFYLVTATDKSGNEGAAATITGEPGAGTPSRTWVLSVGNHPNPFNPRTTVNYTVPSPGLVTVAIHDARGARVATLVDHESRDAGAFAVAWDGAADTGAPVPAGVYFARIEHDGAARSKKIVLLK